MSKKQNPISHMMLYRIISKDEWTTSKEEGKVPRCRSDERENCIHLNKYEDIVLVANKYFIKEEEPVVIEIDAEIFKDQITWVSPTIEKPWHQPNLHLENIPCNIISRYCHLNFNDQSQTFEIPESF